LRPAEQARLRLLQRSLARARDGSHRPAQVKSAIAVLTARERDRRTDWAEKTSTGLARRFDLIRVEDLRIAAMTRSARGTLDRPGRGVRQKAGLNRGILAAGWGLLVRRLEDKAPGRVEKVNPVHLAALQRVRDRRQQVAREPSRLRLPVLRIRLQGGRKRGQEHRRRACGDCAGTLAVGWADEPRTPASRFVTRNGN
jgi:putative transposase